MRNYKEETAIALLRARERFATMQDTEARQGTRVAGYEELRVAIRHLEELYRECESC